MTSIPAALAMSAAKSRLPPCFLPGGPSISFGPITFFSSTPFPSALDPPTLPSIWSPSPIRQPGSGFRQCHAVQVATRGMSSWSSQHRAAVPRIQPEPSSQRGANLTLLLPRLTSPSSLLHQSAQPWSDSTILTAKRKASDKSPKRPPRPSHPPRPSRPPPPSPTTPDGKNSKGINHTMYYVVPKYNHIINLISPTDVVWAILILNILVYFSWTYAMETENLALLSFMLRHFRHAESNWNEGRWWTALTSTFSHYQASHLIINMVSLCVIAIPLATLLRAYHFLCLYLVGGLAGSAFGALNSLYLEPYLLPLHQWAAKKLKRERRVEARSERYSSLGASGSVYSLLSAFALMVPGFPLPVLFIFSVSARTMCAVLGVNEVVGLTFGQDAFSAIVSPSLRSDYAAHLGGLLTGILFRKFVLGWRAGKFTLKI